MEGGGRGTLENLQNVPLHASHLSVVLTQSPDVNQNKAITSSTDDAHSDAYCQRDSLCAYFLTDLCLTVRSSFVCFFRTSLREESQSFMSSQRCREKI